MSRPTQVKPARSGGNRRDFFKRSGSAAMVIAATPLPFLSGEVAVALNALVQHGVTIGDPLPHQVIPWTRVSPTHGRSAQLVEYVVAKDPAFTVRNTCHVHRQVRDR